MRSIEELYNRFSEKKKVLITFHQKPDGDAIGSALGLYHFLLQFQHDITVICPTNWASFLSWMPGADKVINYESNKDIVAKKFEDADWVFCLDFNTPPRVKNMETLLRSTKAEKILIDHHQQPLIEFFDYGISNPDKSSTSEMIFDLIEQSGNDSHINSAIAQCLYAGVMTDTGSFRFSSTTASAHLMVARLMETGFDHSKVHENLFDNFLEIRFRFFGNTLLHRMEVFYEYNAALISIPQNDLIRFNIQTGDTEGLVNFPLSIKGIKLAAIIIDRGEERKSSFRSRGEFDVNVFARKYFNGGGHPNAAGGRNSEPLNEVIKIFKQAIKENASLLSEPNLK